MDEAKIINRNIIKIAEMTTDEEVHDFRTKISTSTLSKRAKEYLYSACDTRLMNIRKRHELEVVNGDIDDFE